MERTLDGRILVVADTSFLVNFLALDRMDVLSRLQIYAFHVPNMWSPRCSTKSSESA